MTDRIGLHRGYLVLGAIGRPIRVVRRDHIGTGFGVVKGGVDNAWLYPVGNVRPQDGLTGEKIGTDSQVRPYLILPGSATPVLPGAGDQSAGIGAGDMSASGGVKSKTSFTWSSSIVSCSSRYFEMRSNLDLCSSSTSLAVF